MRYIIHALRTLPLLVVAAALYIGWTEITYLRGTVLWEFRYLILGAGAILLMSIGDKLTTKGGES